MSGQMTVGKQKNTIIILGSTSDLILAIHECNGWKKISRPSVFFQDHFGFLLNGLTIHEQGKGKIEIFFFIYILFRS